MLALSTQDLPSGKRLHPPLQAIVLVPAPLEVGGVLTEAMLTLRVDWFRAHNVRIVLASRVEFTAFETAAT